MSKITPYNFTVKRGDTFPGVTFAISINDVATSLVGATILCQFRKDVPSAPVALALSVGSGLSVVSAAAGTFKIDKQIFTLPEGAYRYDIQITFASGDVKTYIEGVMTVKETISR